MVGDSISNYIIKIKNAALAGKKDVVTFPYSNLKLAITDVLEKEGFLKNLTKKGKKLIKTIEVELVYENGEPKVRDVVRISKPSKRVYGAASELAPVRSGQGRLIISTSKGVMTDREAKKEKVGGEFLFKIW